MDNDTQQNGHRWEFTPVANPSSTYFERQFDVRDYIAPSRKSFGKMELELRPLTVEEPVDEPYPGSQLKPEPEPKPAREPEPAPEPKLPDDPHYNNWDNLSSKDRKKREKSLIKRGLPIPGKDFDWPPPPPPLPEPVWKESVQEEPIQDPEPAPAPAPEPEPEPAPEPEPKTESPRPTLFAPQSDRSLCVQNVATGSNFLLSLLSDIRDNGAFSDLKIKCGWSTFHAHCCIVCPQSGFFYNAARDGSKEITITDHPLIVKKMLDYLYRQVYDDYELLKEVKAQRSQGQVDRHDGIATIPTYVNATMSVTANKYAIRGLKDLAEKKLVANLMHEWNDAYFIQLVEYVYGANASADPKLEGIVAQFATRHISTLKGFQSFHDALDMWHRFAYLFSREMMERVIQLEKGVA